MQTALFKWFLIWLLNLVTSPPGQLCPQGAELQGQHCSHLGALTFGGHQKESQGWKGPRDRRLSAPSFPPESPGFPLGVTNSTRLGPSSTCPVQPGPLAGLLEDCLDFG